MNISFWRCIIGVYIILSLYICIGIVLYICSFSECMYIVYIVFFRVKIIQKYFGYNNNIGYFLIYIKILNMLKNNYNINCQGNIYSEFVLVNGYISIFKGEVFYIVFILNSDGIWDCLVFKSIFKVEKKIDGGQM